MRKRRIFILLGHPDSGTEPVSRTLADTYEAAARAAGHEVRRMNIFDLTFDPVLHKGYRAIQELEPDRLERLMSDVRLDLFHAGTSRVVAFGAAAPAGVPAGEYPTSSGAGMNCSGYPYIPCSEMSRPASSSSAVTRRP